MRLDIVTAERLVSSEEVDWLVAPGVDGELGILPRHAPLLTALAPGEIRVVKDGEESFIAIGGGFMEVIGNKVTILADTAERADEIDAERAEAALVQGPGADRHPGVRHGPRARHGRHQEVPGQAQGGPPETSQARPRSAPHSLATHPAPLQTTSACLPAPHRRVDAKAPSVHHSGADRNLSAPCPSFRRRPEPRRARADGPLYDRAHG